MERAVQLALKQAGDHSSAFLWRRICRDLDGVLRVGVLSLDPAVAIRLREAHPMVDWVEITSSAFRGEVPLGAQDRLLSVHALVLVTPVTAALGVEERDLASALSSAGAPSRRAVVLEGTHLLARMTDDPERELAEVCDRVANVVPAGWTFAAQPASWLEETRTRILELGQARRSEVARLLLDDAHERTRAALARARGERNAIDALLAEEDQVLETARRSGERAAGHMLGAVRRQTESLMVELGEFLLVLEADIPAQVQGVEDVERIRHTVAHWLHHVVERWIGDRIADWRAAVLAELHAVDLTEDDTLPAELLMPAVHPSPIRPDPSWSARISVTAALGGGAVLGAMGLWVPALIALGSGVALSTFTQATRTAHTRDQLVQRTIEAVRQIGRDAQRVLEDQIARIEDELSRLGDERHEQLALKRTEHREHLVTRRTRRQQQVEAAEEVHQALGAHLSELSTTLGA